MWPCKREQPAVAPEPEPPAFAFDTSIGRVYAIERVYDTADTIITYMFGDGDDARREEFWADLTMAQHNEIVRQWLAGWRFLQWPRPEEAVS
jgi:IS1 family transposase